MSETTGAGSGASGPHSTGAIRRGRRMDIDADTVRLKRGGGEGGHNGLRDIIAQLGNQNGFHRLRLGIGHPGHSSLVSGFEIGRAHV